MPELPEVETVRRTLAPALEGRTISAVSFDGPRTCVGDARETEARLSGQHIERLARHGKYLLLRLRKDGRKSLLVIHLRMTGNLLLNGAGSASASARARRATFMAAIQEVLRNAIGAGGSSIRAYRDGRGTPGAFHRQIQVYGKAGDAVRDLRDPRAAPARWRNGAPTSAPAASGGEET